MFLVLAFLPRLRFRLVLALLVVSWLASAGLFAQESPNPLRLRRLPLPASSPPPPVAFAPHAPAYSLPLDWNLVANAEVVSERLLLNDKTRSALIRQGFVVLPRGREVDMIEPYRQLAEGDQVPLFITSDSLLHLYHVQFDETLRVVEETEFSPQMLVLTRALRERARARMELFSGDLREAARRNVAFFSVAARLLGDATPLDTAVADEVDEELALIAAHGGFSVSPLFHYQEDYSQYVPRGHYTRSDTLRRYFRAMMWYGRMAFLLKGGEGAGPAGEALVSVYDAAVQTRQALWIADALNEVRANGQPLADIWNRIYTVTAFYVGLADDLTPAEYLEALRLVLSVPADFLALEGDADRWFALKKELALRRSPQIFGGTGNASVPPILTPADLDQILEKTKGMRLLGQRFIPDSYMMQQLVLPVVGPFTGTGQPFTWVMTQAGPARGFPRALDVMAVLGSPRALSLLDAAGDTDYTRYDTVMNELIAQFRSLSEADWNRNLYWSWLHALQALLEVPGPGYPAFMQTLAWQDKQLQTALASWTELRHDTILYAKQSYTPEVTSVPPPPPPPPPGYVEPVPEFYRRLLALTRQSRTGLAALNVLRPEQAARLAGLESVLERLRELSVKELTRQPLSAADYLYIHHIADTLQPLVENLAEAQAAQTPLVADVHTDGNTGCVLEEAVGYVRLMVAAYALPEGGVYLGVGPVFSYYEFKWPMSDRLTDEKWQEQLRSGNAPTSPLWVHHFTQPMIPPPADTDGDLLPDAWELRHGQSLAAIDDFNGDPDGDGLVNRLEALADTDPLDPESCLRWLPFPAPGGVPRLAWPGVPGRRYRVCYSENLCDWFLLDRPIRADRPLMEIFAAPAHQASQRFYRLEVVPLPDDEPR